jgi:ribonuclease T2
MTATAARSSLRRAAAFCAALAAAPAAAEDRAGDFDFYVLALSWSPAYCETASRPDPAQCDADIPGFTVHGLWPQYERGWPQYCRNPYGRPTPATVARASDVIPSRGLANYQWEKHGACSGLAPEPYFNLVRRARDQVVIPDALKAPERDMLVSPNAIETSFVAANPGMARDGIAVSCPGSGRIEVRVCLTKTLTFRRCPEVDRSGCRRPTLDLPAAD